MYITLRELFDCRQYTDFPLAYCFDRKAYQICDASLLKKQEEGNFVRYIPLFRIDQKEIQDDYVRHCNDRRMKREFEKSGLSFSAYIERTTLWSDWLQFYRTTVCEVAKQWCIDYSIKYRGEDEFEDK